MQRVVVVGGGYAGASLARELDDVLDVVLVEPKDAFVHAVAALRAVVDGEWVRRVFYPYDDLLVHGRVVQDWARHVAPGVVRLSASESVEADYVVLATGTGYPYPAKYLEDEATVATARLARLRRSLSEIDDVLLVGAGPVGLELAGELTSAFPRLRVTIVDQADDILTTGTYLAQMRDSVRDQLLERGVRLVLGAPLAYLPPVDVGVRSEEPFTVATTAGETVQAQAWFRCYGSRPATGYLDDVFGSVMHHDGSLRVTEHLRVEGFDSVFAIGDITDVRESKRASAAMEHAGVVAANLRALAAGEAPVATYQAAPEMIVLPLGPEGGASQVVGPDGTRIVLGSEETSRLKGVDLFSGAIGAMFAPRR